MLTFALLAALVTSCLAAEICYPQVGCFSNNPPFDNTLGTLPDSPDEIEVHMKVYTRGNKENGETVSFNDSSTITSSAFDKDKFVKIIIHGFGDSINAPWMQQTKDIFLDKYDINVFLIGWAKGAAPPNYSKAASNLRVVGAEVAVLIHELMKLGTPIDKFHLIGFSLGSQAVGEVGKRMAGSIPRITGLDPAGPFFEFEDAAVRLDESDARFVDVVHCNGERLNLEQARGYGMLEQSGHVDINGGRKQPGCKTGIMFRYPTASQPPSGQRKRMLKIDLAAKLVCSHDRATKYFIESLTSECPFTAYSCQSYDYFQLGKCNDCSDNKCNYLGFRVDPRKARGKLYLDTNPEPPFCLN